MPDGSTGGLNLDQAEGGGHAPRPSPIRKSWFGPAARRGKINSPNSPWHSSNRALDSPLTSAPRFRMQDDIELDYDEDEFNDSAVLPSAPADPQPEPEPEPEPTPAPPAPVTETAHVESAQSNASTADNAQPTAPAAEDDSAPAQAAAPEAAPAAAAASEPTPAGKAEHDKTRDKHGNLLPPGWVSKVSSTLGDVYYRNIVTNTSSWEIPTWPADQDPPAEEAKDDRNRNGELHITSHLRSRARRFGRFGGRGSGERGCRWPTPSSPLEPVLAA